MKFRKEICTRCWIKLGEQYYYFGEKNIWVSCDVLFSYRRRRRRGETRSRAHRPARCTFRNRERAGRRAVGGRWNNLRSRSREIVRHRRHRGRHRASLSPTPPPKPPSPRPRPQPPPRDVYRARTRHDWPTSSGGGVAWDVIDFFFFFFPLFSLSLCHSLFLSRLHTRYCNVHANDIIIIHFSLSRVFASLTLSPRSVAHSLSRPDRSRMSTAQHVHRTIIPIPHFFSPITQ